MRLWPTAARPSTEPPLHCADCPSQRARAQQLRPAQCWIYLRCFRNVVTTTQRLANTACLPHRLTWSLCGPLLWTLGVASCAPFAHVQPGTSICMHSPEGDHRASLHPPRLLVSARPAVPHPFRFSAFRASRPIAASCTTSLFLQFQLRSRLHRQRGRDSFHSPKPHHSAAQPTARSLATPTSRSNSAHIIVLRAQLALCHGTRLYCGLLHANPQSHAHAACLSFHYGICKLIGRFKRSRDANKRY